jgi:hypothetical protein
LTLKIRAKLLTRESQDLLAVAIHGINWQRALLASTILLSSRQQGKGHKEKQNCTKVRHLPKPLNV